MDMHLISTVQFAASLDAHEDRAWLLGALAGAQVDGAKVDISSNQTVLTVTVPTPMLMRAVPVFKLWLEN